MSHVQLQPKVLTTTPQTKHVDSGNVGQLGGHQVQPGGGNAVTRFFSNVFGGIRDAFVGLKDRVVQHFADRQAIANQKSADKAATKLAEAFSNGVPSDKKATDLMMNVLRTAGKLQPNDPGGKGAELIRTALSQMPTSAKIAFANRDWSGIKANVNAEVDRRFDLSEHLEKALVNTGLASDSSKSDPQLRGQTKASAGGMIDQIALLSRCEARQDLLPHGVTIDNQGMVQGSFQPHNCSEVLTTGLGLAPNGTVPFDTLFQQMAQNKLNEPDNSQAIPLAGGSARDFPRMHFTFDNNGQQYDTYTPGDNQVADQRLPTTVQALRNFAGSDNAVTVLSSVLNQYGVRQLPRALELPNGTVMNPVFFNMTDSANVQLNNGQNQHFARAGALANLTMNVTQDGNGNFVVDMTCPVCVRELRDDQGNQIPFSSGNPDNALLMTMRTQMIIDGPSAHNGQLNLQLSQPMTFEFQGKMS